MQNVAVTGCAGSVGRRVVGLLVEAGFGVIGLDLRVPDGVRPPMFHRIDLADPDGDAATVKALLGGADAVIHLAAALPEPFPDADSANVRMARRVLDAAADAGVRSVVLLSSATVYGAWPDNPVPLTEEAALRPNPGFAYAFEKAEIERLAAEWHENHPGTALTVLRPAAVRSPPGAAPGVSRWLARTTGPRLFDRMSDELPNLQFVHPSDIATTAVHAVAERLDGTYNVGPDGWIPGDVVPALLGPTSPVPLPDRIVERLRRRPSRHGVPGAAAYGRAPWVVANDRLKATGWRPAVTNEEAIIASRPPGRLMSLVAGRRQEIALAGVVALFAAAATGTIVAAVRWRRRR